jgi:arabinogalactan oligomer/maltooligosaccharide transport system substrate-binding protein
MSAVRALPRVAAVSVAVGVLAGVLVGAPSVQAANQPIVVWADQIRADVLNAQFPQGFRDVKLKIVVKDSLAAIKEELATVKPADAPDVIAAEHDSTGELVDAKLVRSITLGKERVPLFAKNVLNGFRYNSRIYGVPVQFENLAMVTNVSLVAKQPANFKRVVTVASKLVKSGKASAGIAVGQSDSGNAYNMYPFFSGLGGYAFGLDSKGNINTSDVGIASPALVANAGQIKNWNDTKVIDSSLTTQAAKDAFIAGKAPFWITGPWDLNAIVALPFGYRITSVPSMVNGKSTSPLLGMKGFMVTIYAQAHQMKKAADAFVVEGLSRAGVQAAFANAARRMPANIKAGSGVDDARLKAFGAAGAAGVAIPNVPAMQNVWGPLGTAWALSTKGSGATAPVSAFTDAQTKVISAISARG